QYLAAYEPAAQVVGVLKSISKALAWFAQNPMPDLIFSDIELLDGNAFAIYEQVPVGCPIIFITAYDQFLLQAFQGQGIAYLLKPVPIDSMAVRLGARRWRTVSASGRTSSVTRSGSSSSPRLCFTTFSSSTCSVPGTTYRPASSASLSAIVWVN
ncbi:MAG: response regulator, partial [Hymenobacter sp.]